MSTRFRATLNFWHKSAACWELLRSLQGCLVFLLFVIPTKPPRPSSRVGHTPSKTLHPTPGAGVGGLSTGQGGGGAIEPPG